MDHSIFLYIGIYIVEMKLNLWKATKQRRIIKFKFGNFGKLKAKAYNMHS